MLFGIRVWCKFPFFFPIFLCYLCSTGRKRLINEDIYAIHKFNTGLAPKGYTTLFIRLFADFKEFRSQVYFRLKPWSFLLKTLPGQSGLTFNVPQDKLGGDYTFIMVFLQEYLPGQLVKISRYTTTRQLRTGKVGFQKLVTTCLLEPVR